MFARLWFFGLLLAWPGLLAGQTARVRIRQAIDDNRLRQLPHNTHPLARREYDAGAAPGDLALGHMLLVLNPPAERQASLAQFLDDVHNPGSAQYHQWLTPQQFGERFGAADEDIAQVTAWLASYGFEVSRVARSKLVLEFSGNAAQLQSAFHTAMHRYRVRGALHWANSTNPEVPAALAPVVAGIATLHNFRKAPQILATRSQFTASNGQYALAPGDFATIYNINPVYQSGITGVGSTIAVISRSNITLQDVSDFRNAFRLPAHAPAVVLNGADPGLVDGDETEAVLDTSWAGGVAPGANVQLIVSASTTTTDGLDLSEEYVIDNNLADVMTESYGDCESNYTQAQAQFYSQLAAQAAAQGITFAVAAGDSGASGCDDPGSQTVATGPVSVNVLASNPYTTAVGGTALNENGNYSAYWASGNSASGVSALSYIPENVWNESCLAAACGAANAGIWAGGGGVSTLFPKPSWQSGVRGIPADRARDLPDVSFTSALHDFYLICLDSSCTERTGRITFSGVSGTSAATPSFAGIMALIVQSTGARQGLANYKLYGLAAAESWAQCNGSNTGSPPSSGCIFNDVTAGENAVPGQIGYGTANALYPATAGYDLASGLGSVNVANLIYAWNGGAPVTGATLSASIDSPSPRNGTVIGPVSFGGWALSNASPIAAVDVSVDSVPYGAASYGASRSDICTFYRSSSCPDVGWNFALDTTVLANGTHTLAATARTQSGQVYTTSAPFMVANWTASNPMLTSIDTPTVTSSAFSGIASFGGWAIDALAAITGVTVSVDGASYGSAQYGNARGDVCAAFPNYAGCPNVGWGFELDTRQLADGPHVLAITPQTAGGQYSTRTASFTVANTPGNAMTLEIDQPDGQSTVYSGGVTFSGWAVTTSVPVATIGVTIDGVAYGSAQLGGNRPDVCLAYPNAPACPNVGWSFPLDTTRLMNGVHVLGLRAATATGQYTSASRVFSVSNAVSQNPVKIGIDVPAAQYSVLLGTTTLSGWATAAGSVENVSLAIDGVSYGRVVYGAGRPDVCAVYPGDARCPNVGWQFVLDTTRLPGGVHTMTITASSGSGTGTEASTFTIANWTTANPMKINVDAPNAQSGPLNGGTVIGGWAVDAEAALSKIAVAIDGTPLGNAYLGVARPDVCAILSTAIGCPNVGWNYFLDTTLFSDGSHTLSITGTTVAGQSSTSTIGFQIANASTQPVRVNIDAPADAQSVAGTALVGGWAVSTNGAAIATVDILVDGQPNGAASYGSARPDVCQQYSGASGCPGVGWNYLLATSVLANGPHTIEARATATDGSRYTTSRGFNVANTP